MCLDRAGRYPRLKTSLGSFFVLPFQEVYLKAWSEQSFLFFQNLASNSKSGQHLTAMVGLPTTEDFFGKLLRSSLVAFYPFIWWCVVRAKSFLNSPPLGSFHSLDQFGQFKIQEFFWKLQHLQHHYPIFAYNKVANNSTSCLVCSSPPKSAWCTLRK